LALGKARFITIFLGIKVERGLDARIPQDALDGLPLYLGLIEIPLHRFSSMTA
jgi:hypothetical protein